MLGLITLKIFLTKQHFGINHHYVAQITLIVITL